MQIIPYKFCFKKIYRKLLILLVQFKKTDMLNCLFSLFGVALRSVSRVPGPISGQSRKRLNLSLTNPKKAINSCFTHCGITVYILQSLLLQMPTSSSRRSFPEPHGNRSKNILCVILKFSLRG